MTDDDILQQFFVKREKFHLELKKVKNLTLFPLKTVCRWIELHTHNYDIFLPELLSPPLWGYCWNVKRIQIELQFPGKKWSFIKSKNS